MDNILILIVVLAVLIVAVKLFSKEKEVPSGNCRNCPEFRYCGGGRPRCARRSETLK